MLRIIIFKSQLEHNMCSWTKTSGTNCALLHPFKSTKDRSVSGLPHKCMVLSWLVSQEAVNQQLVAVLTKSGSKAFK